MGRLTAPLLALVLGAAAAVALVACGGGSNAKLLPGNTASQITANLDEVKRLAQSGECVGAEDAAQQVSDQIDALGGVDKKLKQALREGADRLSEVVAELRRSQTEAVAPASIPEPTESHRAGEEAEGGQGTEGAPKTTPPATTPTEPTTPPATDHSHHPRHTRTPGGRGHRRALRRGRPGRSGGGG